MTALTRYDRLEGMGLWRPDAATQRREVAVRLGKSSLVISDSRSGIILAHWALPSLQRENAGRRPARFLPGDGDESLETDDDLLIEAIETIQAALTPRPRGRLLRRVALALGVAVTLAGALWLPQVLADRTAAIVPEAMRARIGRTAIERLTPPGAPVRLCGEPTARQVLTGLRNRVLGPDWRVVVIDGLAGFQAGHLPGRMVVLSADLVARLDSPEALAGWMVGQEMAATLRDPLRDVLGHVGLRATLALLSTGVLPDGALDGYAASGLTRGNRGPDPAALIARLAALGIDPAPYAASLQADLRGALPALTPVPPGARLLTDGQWLTLQAICDG